MRYLLFRRLGVEGTQSGYTAVSSPFGSHAESSCLQKQRCAVKKQEGRLLRDVASWLGVGAWSGVESASGAVILQLVLSKICGGCTATSSQGFLARLGPSL